MRQYQAKVIETLYNGYRFRSRLEARWAVCFDTLGIEYRYEPEGFDLKGIWYLPDFFLPKQQCWIEVKPDIPTNDEREKAIRLCLATQQPVVLLGGDVWLDTHRARYGFYPADIERENVLDYFARNPPPKNAKVYWLSTSECLTLDGRRRPFGYDLTRKYAWSAAYLVECSCGSIGIEMPTGIFPCSMACPGVMRPNTDKLKTAYIAARQARFDGKGGTQ